MGRSTLILYFGSRAISAIGNLVSVAVFARLMGPADYGSYILMFAWAIVVYGFAAQWMKFSYFGVYRIEHEDQVIVSYAKLVAASTTIVSITLLLASAILPITLEFAFALIALFVGMTIYEAALEINRTLHETKAVALSMICRAVFVFAFGWLFLKFNHSAFMLALGVAVGHIVATLPLLTKLRRFTSARSSREASAAIIKYGWPLIFSFGVYAIGQTVDRFFIAHYAGNAVVGPYGVIADMMRQTFMVAGESIALALVTVAKQHSDEGRRDESDDVMRLAFRACLTVGSFGAAFFILFGHDLARIILGADFADAADGIIPFLAVAFGFMMLRSFYFGQVIYFSDGTLLELLIAVSFVLSSTVIAVVLVPNYGAIGGAAALMIAHGVSCIISVVVGRRLHVLPIDRRALIEIPTVTAAIVILSALVSNASDATSLRLAASSLLLIAGLAFVGWRFDLLKLLVSGNRPVPTAP